MKLEPKRRRQNLLVGDGLVQLSNSLRVGFDCDCLQRFVRRILEECLEETCVDRYSGRTDTISCILGFGIKETGGLLLGEERQRGRQRNLAVIDFFPGEEREGMAIREKCEVALTYDLMQLCVSKYIPQKFSSENVKIVGWYHSHPREVMLDEMSTVDKETQRSYQAMYENAVCLIVRVELLGRAWLKAITHSYVLVDEIRRALRFYQISRRNNAIPIEWDFEREGVSLSPQTRVHPSWFASRPNERRIGQVSSPAQGGESQFGHLSLDSS